MTVHSDPWYDPARPPRDSDLVDLGGGVWADWGTNWSERATDGTIYPMIWHWCDRSAIDRDADQRATEGRRMAEWYDPQWVPAGCRGHDLISSDPLHVEPSLLWPDCCGKHGFIRAGEWVPV